MAGLTTETANILSEFAVKDMNLAGIGSLVACTPDDETNATARSRTPIALPVRRLARTCPD